MTERPVRGSRIVIAVRLHSGSEEERVTVRRDSGSAPNLAHRSHRTVKACASAPRNPDLLMHILPTTGRDPMFPFVDVAQAAVGFALSMGIGALVFPFRGY